MRSLERFGVAADDIVLDMGAGSGFFAFPASEKVGERRLRLRSRHRARSDRHHRAQDRGERGTKNLRAILTKDADLGLPKEVGTIALMITVLHEVEDKVAIA